MLDNKKEPYWIILADAQLGSIHWQNLLREEDYYRAFQTQCRKAAECTQCLGIIGLGDLRERTSLQAKNLGGLNRGLQILSNANKPLLALMGNHDFTVPNWIEEMCYPSLKNLADPEVQKAHGFNPSTTLALHFTQKSQILAKIKESNPENLELIFLHQSLKELTTNLRQSYDLSLEDLQELGVGKNKECLIFLGDLHNYGDASLNRITAAYPGSLEMTDINEGTNGLKTNKIASGPHDYRKFVIHYQPESQEWEPVAIQPRPWMRLKAKTEKEAQAAIRNLKKEATQWENPGCVLITCPKTQMENMREAIKTINTLEARVEEYQKETEESLSEETTTTSLSWKQNKQELETLASSQLDTECLTLLQEIIKRDGATHNPKNDILAAWNQWFELETPVTTPVTTPETLPINFAQ